MAKQTALAPLTARLLGQHNLAGRLDLLELQQSGAASLPNPVTDAAGWPAVADLLVSAARDKLPTLVYGDYDVDGSFASFMMFRWLRSHGVPGNCFLPSRFRHGYGLDATVMEQAIAQGYRLLVALDCGTANIDEIAQARAAGLEVVVIDHHQPKAQLPDARLLNPHLEPCLGPYCTAGLVWEVLRLLNTTEGLEPAVFGDELELAGLATIADVVPLDGINWLLAHLALLRLPQTVNFGLAALERVSRLHGLTRLTAQQAAFNLNPRLNSAGRMASASLVLDLLGAADPDAARVEASRLDDLNRQRRTEGDRVAREALLQAAQYPDAQALVLYGEDWHLGVLGIVAARVGEHSSKPVVVLANAPGGAGLLTGSARAGGGGNLVQALDRCSDLLIGYGGHAAAAGVKLESEQLGAFRTAFAAAVAAGQDNGGKVTVPPAGIRLHELTADFERDLWNLAPFGSEFLAPVCRLDNVTVAHCNYMGRDRTHINLVVRDGQLEASLKGFNMSHLYAELQYPGSPVSPLIEIDVDNYNNNCTIGLKLKGLAATDAQENNRT